VLFSDKETPISFLLGFLLFESQFCVQLPDVVLEVLLGLFKQTEHEEDFVVHEKWGKNECYSKYRYTRSCIVDA